LPEAIPLFLFTFKFVCIFSILISSSTSKTSCVSSSVLIELFFIIESIFVNCLLIITCGLKEKFVSLDLSIFNSFNSFIYINIFIIN
jgi:hypothetical protein